MQQSGACAPLCFSLLEWLLPPAARTFVAMARAVAMTPLGPATPPWRRPIGMRLRAIVTLIHRWSDRCAIATVLRPRLMPFTCAVATLPSLRRRGYDEAKRHRDCGGDYADFDHPDLPVRCGPRAGQFSHLTCRSCSAAAERGLRILFMQRSGMWQHCSQRYTKAFGMRGFSQFHDWHCAFKR